MPIQVGDRQYELVANWGEMPEGWIWGQVGGVAVDSQDNMHVFTRAPHPYRIYDKSGKLQDHWGEQIFEDAHGICIAGDDDVYLVDRDPQVAHKFNKSGRHLLSMGNRHKPSDTGYTRESPTVTHAGPPFHHPTDISIGPNGEIFVSDGYRNCRVHCYSAQGDLQYSFGEPGNGPGQFVLVHSVWYHKDRLYVADRQNHRVQVFTPQGQHIATWDGYNQPCKIYIDDQDTMYVAELGDRVTVADLNGNVIGRWGDERTHEPGKFWGPHGIWTDSEGSIYVAEVLEGARVQKFARVK
jgi:DNA-binding beta-propeller fold protein YncE